MIIKFIAETDAERKRFGGNEVVEHLNVKEYFIAGNKLDAEGSVVDFHEWNGSFRYLLGTLGYFQEIINDDRRRSSRQDESELPRAMGHNRKIPMVKKGEGGIIQQLDLSRLSIDKNGDLEGPYPPVEAVEDEFIDDKDNAIKFNPTIAEPQAEDIEEAAENIASQLQKEIQAKKANKEGLKIDPST